MACTNIASDTCCFGGSQWAQSVVFAAMPTNWKLMTRSYKGDDRCRIKVYEWPSDGRAEICHGMNAAPFRQYHAGGYSFINNKRGEAEICEALGGSCSKTVRPDTMYLKDGQRYAITGVSDGVIEQMVCAAAMFAFMLTAL